MRNILNLLAMSATHTSRVFGYAATQAAARRSLNQRPQEYHARKARTSIAQLNRWTGKPHEHRREIARRLRQKEA